MLEGVGPLLSSGGAVLNSVEYCGQIDVGECLLCDTLSFLHGKMAM